MKRFMKRIFALSLSAIIAASSVIISGPAINAKAAGADIEIETPDAGTVWNGGVDKSWFTGTQKEYNISTPEQLAGFSELVRDGGDPDRFTGITINLTNDIYLNNVSTFFSWTTKAPANKWDPIGKVGGPIKGYFPFAGVFNGNGHTIYGMYVDAEEPGGLFCYTSAAVIKNLNLVGSVVTSSTDCAGTLIGLSENSYVENVNVQYSIVTAKGGRWAGAGGIIGRCEQENNIAVLSYGLLMACGIIVNPILWFNSDVNVAPSMYGTYVVNSKVMNALITSDGGTYADAAGGIVGGARQAVAMYQCAVANAKISAFSTFGLGESGTVGGLVGTRYTRGGELVENIIKECYVHNVSRGDKYSGFSDLDVIKLY